MLTEIYVAVCYHWANNELTRWGLRRLIDTSQTIFSEHYVKRNLRFDLNSTAFDDVSLIQEMAWIWTGDRPLPKAMMTQLIIAATRHQAPLGHRPNPQQLAKINILIRCHMENDNHVC